MASFWDKIWVGTNYKDYKKYINLKQEYVYLNYFQKYKVKRVCDIACGFGKFSVISSINKYEVYGTDISNYAVEITKNMMDYFKLDYNEYKTCEVTDILFEDNMFDGVIAHSVLDHITYENAKKGIEELARVTKPSGLIYISFDGIEQQDKEIKHEVLEDGSMLYKEGKREGMIFRYYSDIEIKDILKGYEILYFQTNIRGERDIIYQNIR